MLVITLPTQIPGCCSPSYLSWLKSHLWAPISCLSKTFSKKIDAFLDLCSPLSIAAMLAIISHSWSLKRVTRCSPGNICTAASPTWLWLRHRKKHGCERGCDTGSSTHSSILLSSVIRVLPILKTMKASFLKASTSTSCGIMASRLFYLQLVGEICQGKNGLIRKRECLGSEMICGSRLNAVY